MTYSPIRVLNRPLYINYIALAIALAIVQGMSLPGLPPGYPFSMGAIPGLSGTSGMGSMPGLGHMGAVPGLGIPGMGAPIIENNSRGNYRFMIKADVGVNI